MALSQVNAQGHHGYPQPEDEYQGLVYSGYCLRCGISGQQIAPFRLKRSQRAEHSDFLQINWFFDAFFVTPEAATSGSKTRTLGVKPSYGRNRGLKFSTLQTMLLKENHLCLPRILPASSL